MRRKKRLLKDYKLLFKYPDSMFEGVDVILFPNGEPEIWLKTATQGVCIKAGKGPAGMGIHLSTFIGTAPMSVGGNLHPYCAVKTVEDFQYLAICQYNQDEKSQAVKAWFNSPKENRDNPPRFDKE